MTSNVTTLDQDAVTVAIAQYLRDGLNAKFLLDKPGLTISGFSQVDEIVTSLRNYPINSTPNTIQDFPVLTVYGAGSRGELLEERDINCDYFLGSMTVYQNNPAIFRYVSVQIARLLQSDCGGALNLGEYSIPGQDVILRRDSLTASSPNMLYEQFPWIRIQFSIIDSGV